MGSLIGSGGFGAVWTATYLNTPVAVKILTGAAQLEQASSVIEEFKAEVMMLRRLRHPNICLFMGCILDSPNRCIITELASRGSLWDALRSPLAPPYAPTDGATWNAYPTANPALRPPPAHTWPFILVKNVAKGTARGMAYLHGCNPPILHRDMKSANLLLDDNFNVKICDFGLARLKAFTNSHTGNTGTVQWMAPEVLASQRYNEKADVYSFGVILWELLTRECPFDGLEQIQVAMKVLNERKTVEVPAWVDGGVPRLGQLIRATTAYDPGSRPTFEGILLQIEELTNNL
jgi:serine/threonine protein kinase